MKAILILAFWLPFISYGQAVYNANFQALDFSDNPSVPFSGTAGAVNAKYLYTNVITINSQVIDAVVTITGKDNGVTINAVDKTILSAANFESEITIGNTSPLTDGGVTYKFEFIQGGTVASPDPVALQNVMLNSYDIDGNGGKYQYQEFGGFSKYTISSTTTLRAANQANGMTRFQGNGVNTASNGNNINLADNWRIRANFDAMSSFTTKLGGQSNGSQALFSMQFASGANFSSPVTLVNPTVNPKTSSTNTTVVTGTYQGPSSIGASVTITAFSVQINGVTYTTSNGLTFANGTWSVNTQSIPNGTYNVSASVSYSNNYTLIDQTTNELVISNSTPIDNTAPSILSIKRDNPTYQFIGLNELAAKNYVDFDVVFSEPVQGVTADDFGVSGPGGVNAIVSSVTPVSSSRYTVRVSSIPISNTGDLNLDLKAGNNIADISGNLLSNLEPAVHEYYILMSGALASESIQLKAIGVNNNEQLEWSYHGLAPGNIIQVQSSSDGRNWKTLTEMPVSIDGRNTYTDLRNLNVDRYYRISVSLPDNRNVYSNVVVLKTRSTELSFEILENPVKHRQLRVMIYRPGYYCLFAADGRKCFSTWLDHGQQLINVSNLRSASYFFGLGQDVRTVLVF